MPDPKQQSGGAQQQAAPAQQQPAQQPQEQQQQPTGQPVGDQPTAGCQALYNGTQGLMDVIATLMGDLKKSDDLGLRRYGKRVAAKIKAIAGDMKARCDKHKSRVDGSDDMEGEDADVDYFDDETEMDPELKAIELDPNGTVIVKAFPDWKPRRYKVSDLLPVSNVQSVPATPAPSPQKAVGVQLATDPTLDPDYQKALADAEAARKRLKKAKSDANALLNVVS